MIVTPSRLVLALSTLFLASACTSTPHAEGAEHEHGGHEHGGHEHGEHEHHKKLPPSLHEFHEVLGPLWHADKGPERTAKTCAAASMLHDKAIVVMGAPAPENADAAAWKTHGTALDAATTALVAECAKEGKPAFEERFKAVHEAFHETMEGLQK